MGSSIQRLYTRLTIYSRQDKQATLLPNLTSVVPKLLKIQSACFSNAPLLSHKDADISHIQSLSRHHSGWINVRRRFFRLDQTCQNRASTSRYGFDLEIAVLQEIQSLGKPNSTRCLCAKAPVVQAEARIG